jgi:hypothetical protein
MPVVVHHAVKRDQSPAYTRRVDVGTDSTNRRRVDADSSPPRAAAAAAGSGDPIGTAISFTRSNLIVNQDIDIAGREMP